jgi:hypothetical protein
MREGGNMLGKHGCNRCGIEVKHLVLVALAVFVAAALRLEAAGANCEPCQTASCTAVAEVAIDGVVEKVIDVTSDPYCAVADDDIDDSTALKYAIRDAVSCGASLYVPAGRYDIDTDEIDGGISIDGNLVMYGDPSLDPDSQTRSESIIAFIPELFVEGEEGFTGNGFVIQSPSHVVFRDLHFAGRRVEDDAQLDASHSLTPAFVIIRHAYSGDAADQGSLTLERCSTGASTNALRAMGGQTVSATDCFFEATYKAIVGSYNTAYAPMYDFWNCYFDVQDEGRAYSLTNYLPSCIYISKYSSLRVQSCSFKCNGRAIKCHVGGDGSSLRPNADFVEILGSRFESASGIITNYGTKTRISDCTFVGDSSQWTFTRGLVAVAVERAGVEITGCSFEGDFDYVITESSVLDAFHDGSELIAYPQEPVTGGVSVTRCTFDVSPSGAVIYRNYSSCAPWRFEDCTFAIPQSNYSNGGGILFVTPLDSRWNWLKEDCEEDNKELCEDRDCVGEVEGCRANCQEERETCVKMAEGEEEEEVCLEEEEVCLENCERVTGWACAMSKSAGVIWLSEASTEFVDCVITSEEQSRNLMNLSGGSRLSMVNCRTESPQGILIQQTETFSHEVVIEVHDCVLVATQSESAALTIWDGQKTVTVTGDGNIFGSAGDYREYGLSVAKGPAVGYAPSLNFRGRLVPPQVASSDPLELTTMFAPVRGVYVEALLLSPNFGKYALDVQSGSTISRIEVKGSYDLTAGYSPFATEAFIGPFLLTNTTMHTVFLDPNEESNIVLAPGLGRRWFPGVTLEATREAFTGAKWYLKEAD